MSFFFGLVGLGLVFQDLWDVPAVGFRGDEDGRQLEGSCQSWLASHLLAFVFLDAP